MARRLLGVLLAAAWVAAAGCQPLAAERTISPTAVREAVQAQLDAALVETPPVDVLPTLTDVEATYTMRNTNERLLLIVFSSGDATVQFTGGGARSGTKPIVVRNVVAVYEHDRGTVSRREQLRAALERVDRAGA